VTETKTCAYCGERFATIAEHGTHIIAVHSKGFVPRSERRLRRSSLCWSCAAEIPATVTYCSCGALHPRLR
jgi:hypothetical protein